MRSPCRFTVVPVSGEPTVDVARSAVAIAREFAADVVLAVGGGSVLDLGKATAALLANGGDPLDYLEVPTTSGTGSEVTANAVLASPQHSVKASLRNPSMLPAIAVVDADLTVRCPPAVTAASGLDALTQCLEPYVSAVPTAVSGPGGHRTAETRDSCRPWSRS